VPGLEEGDEVGASAFGVPPINPITAAPLEIRLPDLCAGRATANAEVGDSVP